MPRPRKSEEPALKPVKVQGIEIPLYRLGDGRTAFADTFGGPRNVRKFTDEGEAREEAKKLAMQVLRGEALRTDMDRGDIESYRRAMEILRPTGIPLTVALADFAEAWNLTKGRPLLDVVRAGIDNMDRPVKTCSDVFSAFLAEKLQQGLSSIYIRELTNDLTSFCEDYGTTSIARVTAEDVQAWLIARKTGTRRRNNLRATLVSMFVYAQEKKWLPFGPLAPQEIKKSKIKKGAVSVYTPAEMRFWISNVQPKWFPWLVIVGFSGVRSEEVCPPPESLKDRLRWEDLKWKGDAPFFNIRPEVSKVNERRLVPIPENLANWLHAFKGKTGPVIPKGLRVEKESDRLSQLSKRLDRKAEKFPEKFKHPCPGLVWRRNALRHSNASYRMAIIQNAPQLSYEMGNSVAMIKRHYLEAQEQEIAFEYFSIRPGDASNIIQMSFAV